MTLESLTDLLIEELQDLYDAEHQIVEALPQLAKKAFSPELEEAFNEHLEQTKGHITRLEAAFKKFGIPAERKSCKAMRGLMAEGEELLEEEPSADPSVLDAALIAAAQKVEHYEIASYGTARSYAQLLKATEVQKLLQQTLDEEAETDRKLTNLAEQAVNLDVAEADIEIQHEAAS